MIGFAGSMGTAVLPMCSSITNKFRAPSASRMRSASRWYNSAQRASWDTTRTVPDARPSTTSTRLYCPSEDARAASESARDD